jgi:hypothetical protein
MVGKAMPHAGKNTTYLQKSGNTIIAIDALRMVCLVERS